MTAVLCDIYLFSISTLFKILEWATSSYVGSVLKKSCQKAAMGNKGLMLSVVSSPRSSQCLSSKEVRETSETT